METDLLFATKKTMADALLEKELITFGEWYRVIVHLLEERKIPHAKEINFGGELS